MVSVSVFSMINIIFGRAEIFTFSFQWETNCSFAVKLPLCYVVKRVCSSWHDWKNGQWCNNQWETSETSRVEHNTGDARKKGLSGPEFLPVWAALRTAGCSSPPGLHWFACGRSAEPGHWPEFWVEAQVPQSAQVTLHKTIYAAVSPPAHDS